MRYKLFLLFLLVAPSALAQASSQAWPKYESFSRPVAVEADSPLKSAARRVEINIPVIADACAPDRAGDAVPADPSAVIDIVGLCAGTNGVVSRVVIDFSYKSTLDQLGGYVYFDIDHSPETGFTHSIIPGIGYEYFLRLFELSEAIRDGREPMVPLYDARIGAVAYLTAMVIGNRISVDIPVEFMNDDGNVTIAAWVGDQRGATDTAPDGGPLKLLEARAEIFPGSSRFLSTQSFDLGIEVETGNSALLALPLLFVNGRQFNLLAVARVDAVSRKNTTFYVVPNFNRFLLSGRNTVTVILVTARGFFGDEVEFMIRLQSLPTPVPQPPPPPPGN